MSDEFAQPGTGGGYFISKDALGHLILITQVHDVYHNPTNVYRGIVQPRDEAKVDYVDLDSWDKELHERVIMTHPGLVNRLATGKTNILGRVSEQPTKDGNNTFYALDPHEDADVQRAKAWLDAYRAGQFQNPATNAPQGPPGGAQSQSGAQAQPNTQGQQVTPPQSIPGLPPGVDPAQLAALLGQLGAQPVQPPTSEPPF